MLSTMTFRIGLRLWGNSKSTTFLQLSSCSRSGFTAAQHSNFSSLISSPTKRSYLLPTASRIALSTRVPSNLLPRKLIRSASTASATVNPNHAQSALDANFDWNAFFRLRTSRRRYTLASSIVSSIGVTGAMFVFLSTQPELADEVTKLIPLDPVISMGILTFSATFVGWLIGPIFGNAVWKIFNRARLPEFNVKERAFFERIKRHRVNPMGASTNNPVPDYYGEKIGSVGGYRRWLKDQRAFNRKREGVYRGGI